MAYHIKNAQELEEKLKEAGSKLVVIDFNATWCGPCKIIAPKLDELAAQYPEIMVLKVDVDECEDIAATYEIEAMPTFVFIKEQKKIESFDGAYTDKLIEVVMRLK